MIDATERLASALADRYRIENEELGAEHASMLVLNRIEELRTHVDG